MGQPQGPHSGLPLDAPLIDIYRIAVESAERVSERRGTTNAFFSGLHAALVGVLGVAGPIALPPSALASTSLAVGLTVVSGVGLVLCGAWFVLLKSYRDLNNAKFSVILELEQSLPVGLFTEEWQSLKQDPVPRWRDRYSEFGDIERVVPGLFASVYAMLIALIWSAWT